MYIQLFHRSLGVHTPIKHLEIDLNLDDVYKGEDNIDEALLLTVIPEGWLPVKPSDCLLTVANDNGGSAGQYTEIFRPWAKYFDSYVLELLRNPAEWWEEIEDI